MKKIILVLILLSWISLKLSAQTSAPANTITIVFVENEKEGQLYFDEDTYTFHSGWVSYPVPYGDGAYYMLPVNSVAGQLIGEPLAEPIEDIDFPLPTPLSPNFSHFDGTIYYGSGSEWGNLILHSGNNGVLNLVAQ